MKRHLKKSFTLLFFFIFFQDSYAMSIAEVKLLNPVITPHDSVKVACKYLFPASPAYIYSHHIVDSGFQLTVNICGWNGPQGLGVEVFDTINLGLFPVGSYTLTLNYYGTLFSDSLCNTSFWDDSAQINFNVVEPTNIHHAGFAPELQIQHYTAKELLTGQVNDIAWEGLTYEIRNLNGVPVINTGQLNSSRFEINISALPSGLYFLVVHNEKHRVVKRFVKTE